MKKIIFFSKNLCIGGMENALVNLLNVLVLDYEVTLVLEEKRGVLLEKLDDRVTVKEYKMSNCKNKIIRKALNFSKRLLWTIKNENNFDFSCNYATYSVIGSRLAACASKNSAYYVHSNYYAVFEGDEQKLKSFFEPHKIYNFKSIICVSNESMEGLKKVLPQVKEKLFVVNNIIDYERIRKQSLEKKDIEISNKYLNFIFVGRLENESKNLKLLLESFRLVLEKSSNYKLYIVGDGPYMRDAKNFIKENILSENIIMIGEDANPYPYLKMCDCFILTSNYEGFPVVYIESLVLNKPIMGTITSSDESLDMKDYIIKLDSNSENISTKILEFKRKDIDYKIDFDELNKLKIDMIKSLIER